METLRTTESLKALDSVIFWKLSAPEGVTLSPRDEFYVCNRLIQLMENVYADLDLECNWDHPHVKGWRGMFENWVRTEAFER